MITFIGFLIELSVRKPMNVIINIPVSILQPRDAASHFLGVLSEGLGRTDPKSSVQFNIIRHFIYIHTKSDAVSIISVPSTYRMNPCLTNFLKKFSASADVSVTRSFIHHHI
jgi:hypothetical protein